MVALAAGALEGDALEGDAPDAFFAGGGEEGVAFEAGARSLPDDEAFDDDALDFSETAAFAGFFSSVFRDELFSDVRAFAMNPLY